MNFYSPCGAQMFRSSIKAWTRVVKVVNTSFLLGMVLCFFLIRVEFCFDDVYRLIINSHTSFVKYTWWTEILRGGPFVITPKIVVDLCLRLSFQYTSHCIFNMIHTRRDIVKIPPFTHTSFIFSSSSPLPYI